jgi:hypothetical protein
MTFYELKIVLTLLHFIIIKIVRTELSKPDETIETEQVKTDASHHPYL